MTALAFNAFVMNTVSHIQHGLWRHPDAQQADFEDVNVWIELARTLEAGLFDAIFFADVVGVYGPVGGDYTVNAREGLQIPSNDPSVLLSALAVNTEHLGLAFTSSVLQAHPFEFARRASTLDHISKGRVAWNIVTSTMENAARNFGLDRLTAHDERYVWAEEYLEVAFKLWEGSWEDDALRKDRSRGVFSDASRIHRINHVGKRYRVEGPHLPSPSPQRTPLLFQAGSSPAGRASAARNAEAQFISTPNPQTAKELITETRDLAERAGRRRDDIKFFQGFAFVIGSTEAEAKRKEAELDSYLSVDGFLAHSNLGVSQDDGRPLPPETLLKDIETNGGRSHIEWLRKRDPNREPTVGDLGQLVSKRHPRLVGTPEQIADALALWQQAGIDGVNLINWIIPGSYQEFNAHLLPELQRRGLAKREYAPGTLRRKLFGRDRLDERHPGARWRGAFARSFAAE
ncbi:MULTISPECIES: LLM class flavin-dependent oxidoreductase [Bradyrhizobium]|jgi:FMN-dependent oxidoreductase (nitrilotriacetate monooxygenase family)|uniref:LLM class flavin-dependent oxidoreductase n=2 Tax=Nitrobacteraceae TaxID=41294 RepID=UPI0003A9CBF1|nr:LLM class flavin-dependent oxidoreductase [Bradyrhizobium denitrificans]MCL8483786.1 LLM class flavin-dependent oxidoreductase [Bradyrhizobium denitrificans]